MCGIVGYVGMHSAQQVLLDGLEKLEYRGYDSAGVALTQRDGIRVVKSKGRLATLRSKLEELSLPQSSCGIGHTRWATHGEPSDVNSHPHSTPRVSIVHNGIIENYGALKERLIAKGYTFASETDTEVLVKLIDSCYQGEPLQALQAALAKVRGSYALAVLFKDYPENIIDLADIYIRTIFAGIPFTLLYNVTSALMRALGDSKRPLYFLLVASVLNIGLDLACIILFNMGVFGAAFATVFSQAVAGIGSLIYIMRHYPELRWNKEEGRISAPHCAKLCAMGLPMGLQCSITAIGSVVLQGAVNGLGSPPAARLRSSSACRWRVSALP